MLLGIPGAERPPLSRAVKRSQCPAIRVACAESMVCVGAVMARPQVCEEYAVVAPCMGTGRAGSPFPLPEGCSRPWQAAGTKAAR